MVLKFGDNRPKGRGVRGSNWGKFREKSNYAKTGGPIKIIFRGFVENVITNIVLKFGGNWPKEGR